LLVRTSQQNDIVQCLLASGCWIPADRKESDDDELALQIPRLKRLGQDFHILLWSEDLYDLKVDGELCEAPHICAWNAVLAESRFYHPAPPCVSLTMYSPTRALYVCLVHLMKPHLPAARNEPRFLSQPFLDTSMHVWCVLFAAIPSHTSCLLVPTVATMYLISFGTYFSNWMVNERSSYRCYLRSIGREWNTYSTRSSGR
jgi:hypothetical protein